MLCNTLWEYKQGYYLFQLYVLHCTILSTLHSLQHIYSYSSYCTCHLAPPVASCVWPCHQLNCLDGSVLNLHMICSTTHTVHKLYRIMVMASSVVGVMKMGNIAPRVGIRPPFLAVWASVLTITPPKLPDVTILLAGQLKADYYSRSEALHSVSFCRCCFTFSQN